MHFIETEYIGRLLYTELLCALNVMS